MSFVVAVGTGSQWWVANGGEREVEVMSWHIIDVTGHSAVMRHTQVHTRIYACRTLSCRLHSISTTETNTLAYTRRHTVTCAVTRTLYALDMHYSKF